MIKQYLYMRDDESEGFIHNFLSEREILCDVFHVYVEPLVCKTE